VGAIVTKMVVGNVMGLGPATLIGLILGAILGAFAGLVIAKTNIPPFIMTLGLQISVRGATYLVCEGKPIGNLPENMLNLGLGTFNGIPIPVLFMIFQYLF